MFLSVSDISPHIKFYHRDDIPSSFHYRDNDRIPPIVGFADLGWQVKWDTKKTSFLHRSSKTH